MLANFPMSEQFLKLNMLVVESASSLRDTWKMILEFEGANVFTSNYLEPNFPQFVTDFSIDAAIIHNLCPLDGENILQAHRSGLAVVIFERVIQNIELTTMYESLKKAQIPVLTKIDMPSRNIIFEAIAKQLQTPTRQ